MLQADSDSDIEIVDTPSFTHEIQPLEVPNKFGRNNAEALLTPVATAPLRRQKATTEPTLKPSMKMTMMKPKDKFNCQYAFRCCIRYVA